MRVKNKFEDIFRFIGLKIKSHRILIGLTQADLASKCDLDIRTIQRIEKGEMNMSLNVLLSLLEVLEINWSDLIDFPPPH